MTCPKLAALLCPALLCAAGCKPAILERDATSITLPAPKAISTGPAPAEVVAPAAPWGFSTASAGVNVHALVGLEWKVACKQASCAAPKEPACSAGLVIDGKKLESFSDTPEQWPLPASGISGAAAGFEVVTPGPHKLAVWVRNTAGHRCTLVVESVSLSLR